MTNKAIITVVAIILGLLAFFWLISCQPHERAIVTCNGSTADCQSKINQANNGDTVNIPAGNFTWTTTLNITKAITLQGAGIGKTIINATGPSGGRSFQWTLPKGNYVSRMTGIEFTGGTGGSWPTGWAAFIGDNTSGTQLRFDHCKLTGIKGQLTVETIVGVMDHCEADLSSIGITVMDSYWNGDAIGRGDLSYEAPSNWGSSQFFFIEDCTFRLAGTPGHTYGITDTESGARFVIRHCILNDVAVQTHGTETRYRGGRAIEMYDNTFNYTLTNSVGGLRSGVVLMHDNIVKGVSNGVYDMQEYRVYMDIFPWGAVDGVNSWDINEPTLFASGNVTAKAPFVITDSGKSFPANGWVGGYALRKPTGGSGRPNGSIIVSNTGNTITYHGNNNGDDALGWVVGDPYEIRKPIQAFDSIGRTEGFHVVNGPGGTPSPPPVGSNNQVTEPCYSWANTNLNLRSQSAIIRDGEHYKNNTAAPGYTAYTYPHPLVSGGGASPTPIGPTPTASPEPSTTPPSPTATPPSSTGAPVAPSGAYVSIISKTQLTPHWVDNSSNETGFKVERSTDNVTFVEIATAPQNATGFQDSALTPGTKYYYRVRAYSSDGDSGYSNVASGTTYGAPVPTPTATASPVITPSATPTATSTPVTPAPTPTATVTAAPTATPAPSVALCIVPNLVGMKVMDAQNRWTQSGFNIPLQSALPGQGNKVSGQSITAGTSADCATTIMTVN